MVQQLQYFKQVFPQIEKIIKKKFVEEISTVLINFKHKNY